MKGIYKEAMADGERRDGFPEETEEGWESWACKPIILFPISPRQARSILIVCGVLISFGMSFRNIIYSLIGLDCFPGKEERLLDTDYSRNILGEHPPMTLREERLQKGWGNGK
jgi:hypothetical protein